MDEFDGLMDNRYINLFVIPASTMPSMIDKKNA